MGSSSSKVSTAKRSTPETVLFKTNSLNELVTISGQRLLGHGVDENFQIQSTSLTPVTIPLGAAAVAQSTENVFLEGTFTPTGTVGTQEEIIQSAILSDGSLEVPTDLATSDIGTLLPPDVSGAGTALGGAGAVADGTYSYRLVNVDASGQESAPSVDIGPIVVTGGPRAVDLTGLPDAMAGFVSRNLYRTDATGTGDYQLVSALPATGATFSDTVVDGSLGATLDEDTLPLGNYSYFVTYYNNASGLESRPTTIIGPEAVTVANRRIQLSNIPQPTSGDFDSVRIYRNLSTDDDAYHLVSTLTGGETTYIDGALDATISGNQQMNRDGPSISLGLALTDVTVRDGDSYSNPFEIGTLAFTGRKGGRTLNTQEFEITALTTVQEFIEFMEEGLGIVEESGDVSNPIQGNPGGQVVASSRIQLASNLGTESAINIPLSGLQLTNTAGDVSSVNLGFGSTQSADGESAVTDFVVFDSLGYSFECACDGRARIAGQHDDDLSLVRRQYRKRSSQRCRNQRRHRDRRI